MNPIQEVIQGFFLGLIAGFWGYISGITTEAIFEAFGSINSSILLLGIVFAIITFFAGIAEAYLTGIFFSIGVLTTGYLLNDFGTIVTGLISIIGIIISLFKGKGSRL